MKSNEDFKLSSYHYELPQELIAQRPVERRDHSRLLVYREEDDRVEHVLFKDLPNYLPENTSLVLNNSKVFPCRLNARKPSGGKVEIFLLQKYSSDGGYSALLKSSGKKRVGERLIIDGGLEATIESREEKGSFKLSFNGDILPLLEKDALVPIPPYIRGGQSDEQDRLNYQTIYASGDKKAEGSVAAPTAGLHFTDKVFNDLDALGIGRSFVTLQVGLGTFSPVKVDDIREHPMHSENYYVEQVEWLKILSAKKRIAVGTTSLRVLESLWPDREQYRGGEVKDTDIFLYPGKEIASIDGLITNFHLPESTLLMLVSSLIGREKTLELYNLAVKEGYRFFSYGDAMLILRKPSI